MMIDITKYRRPALHFSGGKDSLACLYLARPQLDRITVYWVNPGDPCKETLSVVDSVRAWVPNFVELSTDAIAWRSANGDPSDLVPASGHELGVAYSLGARRVSSRFDCCFANLMRPMHERMLQDGVDAVIRGTKTADTGRVPAVGHTKYYDILLPIAHWTHEDVFRYLQDVGAPRNGIYDYAKGASAPECATCTAWWDDHKSAWLKATDPAKYVVYRDKLKGIRVEVVRHLADLDSELEV